MQTYLLSALVAFAVVLVLGPIVIPMLRRLKFGQVEREEGPDSHKNKQGTPTMGGIMTLLGVLVATLIFGLESAELVLPALLVTFAFGLVGFLDDFIKVRLKRNLGLRAYQKIIAQFGIALLVALWAYRSPYIGSSLYLPISGGSWDIGVYYIPLVMFVVIGTTNAVNLTDGLDGLASGVTMIYTLAMTIVFALLSGRATLLGQTLYGVNLDGRRVPRLYPLQHVPGPRVHGRHGLARARRRHRHDGHHEPLHPAAAGDGLLLRRVHGVGHPAGRLLQAAPRQARVQDGADPPPL